ncbi:rab11 family-interacting protein 1 isoform X2 [Esox lucius]|uniref:C2 domain-containing protein n=1 Tax=Esox lucius TaxID=8010 RepID=A0A3P8YXR6_ESOLU|nr:rab11 family-interacting protein 1 isoform X2 [Esox lucius]
MSLSDQSQQWYPTSVQVTVLQARSLRIKGKNGTNDAYAIMQVAKDKFSTSVAEKSVAPVWKEEATFELPLFHNGNTDNCTLHVNVMHRALMGPDKLLGRADINLWELSELKSRNKTEWYTLLDKTGKQDKDRGEVLVDIQFMKNNMTASMFDLSATDKPRSRLGKFKDKVRGKKKEGLSDSASAVVPSFNQVLTESDGEGDVQGEDGAEKDKKKKKNKLKSLFSPKSNLQRQGLSQSMSVLGPLPEKNTSLTDSHSSGLNIDSSEGKKKFKFLTQKRTESSDSKASQGSLSLGRTKIPAPVEPSNLCINGSHVYTEEPRPRSSGTGSTFSLASSGHDSMEDLHSPDSRAVEQYDEETVWMDEERRRKGELERNSLEEERMRKEEQEKKRASQEEERLRFEEEERRLKEEERMRIKLEESIRKEEQEKRKKVEEEKIRLVEERKMMEEKERMRRQEEEEERLRKEDQERRSLEEKRREIEEQERREEEEQMRREEHERMKREDRLRREEEEERNIRGEEERLQREKEERIREENERIRKEEEKDLLRREEEHRKMQEEEERGRKEEERLNREKEEERKREKDRLRNEEKKIREEEERVRKAEEEERVRKAEEEERVRKAEEEERVRKAEEEERVRKAEEEERVRKAEEEERVRKAEEEERVKKAEEEERVRKEMEVKRTKEEEQIKRGEADGLRKLEEERKIRDEERLRREEVRRMEEEQRRKEEEKRLEERKNLDEENKEEKRRDEEQRRALMETKERFRVEEEFRRQDERMREEEEKRNAQIKGEVRLEEVEKQMEQKSETTATLSNNPFEEVSPSPFGDTISNNPFEETPTTSPIGPISCRTNKVSAVKPRPHPVKPLNSVENQLISNNQEAQAGKSTGILGGLQEKIKLKDTGVKGPYSQLTQEELISLVVKQQEQLSNRDNKIKELEQYIDNLLVRIIEEHPSILMS